MKPVKCPLLLGLIILVGALETSALLANPPGRSSPCYSNRAIRKHDDDDDEGNSSGLQATRRSVLLGSVMAIAAAPSMVLSPMKARAVGEGEQRMVFKQKPTAPIGALLPAVQQRLLLEASLDLCKKGDFENIQRIVAPLDDSYIQNMNGSQNMKVIKKYNPAQVLRGDVVRAAMNLYQTNLNYNNLLSNPSDAFTVTDPTWKKSYIRANDGLPDLQRVIGADIDMRQLLRNQVQEKIDDAAAELYAPDRDDQELLALLQDAAQSFDMWLDRVRTGDVRDALQAAMKGESVKVYDAYAAGFLPPSL